MAFFPDLTPHTYAPTDDLAVLNVGWLDEGEPFPVGPTTAAFRAALRVLCEHPILLHRGSHECWPCLHERRSPWSRLWLTEPRCTVGNGQIRVRDGTGTWYAAPTLVHHYVMRHQYRPPEDFIAAVLSPVVVGIDAGWQAERKLARPNCRLKRFV
ncbi:MAG TPA: hypothetical protein VH092_32180 [Urbifossiella sp.]|jgi:hypothetical protein|nr:hypothetical protein [Urbifossiella sp.]